VCGLQEGRLTKGHLGPQAANVWNWDGESGGWFDMHVGWFERRHERKASCMALPRQLP
jgi:hypothetical protein